jgi:hypothetical protein
VGVHSSAIACGIILDEVVYGLDVLIWKIIVRLRCLFGGIVGGVEERKKEEGDLGFGNIFYVWPRLTNFSLCVCGWACRLRVRNVWSMPGSDQPVMLSMSFPMSFPTPLIGDDCQTVRMPSKLFFTAR